MNIWESLNTPVARRGFDVFFWMSILFTLDIVFSQIPGPWRSFDLKGSGELVFLLVATLEAIALFSAVLLLGGMVAHCLTNPGLKIGQKILWFCLMLIGIWWVADVYYISVYRPRRAR
jgi:hypothetical protein